MEAQTRLAEVILLENDDERQSTLGVVGDLYVKLPQSPDDHAAFEADIEKCRGGLAALKWTLAGAFAPRAQATATANQIATKTTPQLKTKPAPQLGDGVKPATKSDEAPPEK